VDHYAHAATETVRPPVEKVPKASTSCGRVSVRLEMAVDDNDDDPRRMHSTPRSRIAELVEELRAEGWEIELEETDEGELHIFQCADPRELEENG
jgi:hypothetical protein